MVADSVGDAFAAVSDVYGPDPTGHRIKVLLALGVPDPHPLAFNDDAGINGFILLVLREVVPDMDAVGLDHLRDVIQACIVFHGGVLSIGL